MTESNEDRALEALVRDLVTCPPSERIGHRDGILAYGEACIAPLVASANAEPDLTAQVAAWLVHLAKSLPQTESAAVRALAALSRGPEGQWARSGLERLGRTAPKPAARTARRAPRANAAEAAVHARIIAAARAGQILTYSQLETNRRYIGRYLLNILQAEHDLGRPPLTAIVVGQADGRPGDGFLPAMEELGFAQRGEAEDVVWKRAVAAVHEYWSAHPDA